MAHSKSKLQPHIHLEPSPRYARVLTCGAPERAKLIASKLEKMEPLAQNREYHSYLGKYQGKDVLVMSHGVGASGMGICVQELINVGAKSIIRLGTAGGLQDDSQVGDTAVATAAVRQEGLSKLMVPVEFPAVADLELTQALMKEFKASGMRNRSGIVVSSDLFYPGLLDGQLALYRDAGAVAVEMECSALFVIGSLKGIKTGSALVMDGNPLKWQEGHYAPGSDTMKKAIEGTIDVCLKAIVSVEL